jgi:hypothetical protein
VRAIEADGDLRGGAEVSELTGLVPAEGYPKGTRFIVRRERPHPGAQLSMPSELERSKFLKLRSDSSRGILGWLAGVEGSQPVEQPG